jgi:hypothetical protein
MDEGELSTLLSSRSAVDSEYQLTSVVCCRTSRRDPARSLACSKGMATQCSGRKPYKNNS